MRRLWRFSSVGILNTLIHGGLLILLVEWFDWTPPPANVVAFFGANLFGFVAHSLFTFQMTIDYARYPRFLMISGLGSALSYAISVLGVVLGWHYLSAFLLQILLMPIINFILLRSFVFIAR